MVESSNRHGRARLRELLSGLDEVEWLGDEGVREDKVEAL